MEERKNEKIEMLENIISGSKTFYFKYDDVLNITDYYTGRKSINIDFTKLIEAMFDYLDGEVIDEILLTDEEAEERGENW